MTRPRRWLVLTVESPSALLNDALAEGLVHLGGSAVQEDGLRLSTYIAMPGSDAHDPAISADDDAEAAEFAASAARVLAERAECTPPRVTWHWQADEDWLSRWRAGLAPRTVGKRLIVAPTWTLPEVHAGPDRIVIAIDPQMAFGTGEHASTRGVLRLLEQSMRAGAAVLDVGTGSAILAIAADRLGAASVLAVESDAEALDNARENLQRNEAFRVRLECAVVDDAYLRSQGGARFDLILANVLRSALEPLLPAFRAALRAGGTLILGGILQAEAEPMRAAAVLSGFRVVAEDREEEWWSASFV